MRELIDAEVVIPEGDVARGVFEKKLAQLNRKAEKFGLPPVTVTTWRGPVSYVGHQQAHESGDDVVYTTAWSELPSGAPVPAGKPLMRAMHARLSYPVIKLGQWRVIAKLEAFGEDDKNLVFQVGEEERDAERLQGYQQCRMLCEHCKTSRTRNNTFVLANEAGETVQVGSNCLKDFTGIDPAQVLFLAKLYHFVRVSSALDALGEATYRDRANAVQTDAFLADVIWLTEKGSFVSSRAAKVSGIHVPTYESARVLAVSMGRASADEREAWWKRREELMATTVPRVRAWVEQLEPASQFESNLQLLLAEDSLLIHPSHLAFAAAAVPAYSRALARKAESQASQEAGYFGEKAKRTTQELQLLGHASYSSMWGTTFVIKLKTPEGHQLVWKTQKPPSELVDIANVGRSFDATFTVKGHAVYREQMQTEVSRLAMSEWTDEKEDAASMAMR